MFTSETLIAVNYFGAWLRLASPGVGAFLSGAESLARVRRRVSVSSGVASSSSSSDRRLAISHGAPSISVPHGLQSFPQFLSSST